jgi:hypothetical protein
MMNFKQILSLSALIIFALSITACSKKVSSIGGYIIMPDDEVAEFHQKPVHEVLSAGIATDEIIVADVVPSIKSRGTNQPKEVQSLNNLTVPAFLAAAGENEKLFSGFWKKKAERIFTKEAQKKSITSIQRDNLTLGLILLLVGIAITFIGPSIFYFIGSVVAVVGLILLILYFVPMITGG